MADYNIEKSATLRTGAWAGMDAAEAKALYAEIYKLGTISSAHFAVKLSPLFSDGELAKSNLEIFADSFPLPWLAQNVDMSLIDTETDSIKVGALQLNHITGNASPEIPISFLEVKSGAIARSLKSIQAITFSSDDGTQRPPADYLMKLEISAFDRMNYSLNAFSQEYIVALQSASVPFDANNRNSVVIIPVVFTQMFPMFTYLST